MQKACDQKAEQQLGLFKAKEQRQIAENMLFCPVFFVFLQIRNPTLKPSLPPI